MTTTTKIFSVLSIATLSFLAGCQSTNPASFARLQSSAPLEKSQLNQNSSPSLLTISEPAQFNEIVQQAPGVVLVDFYADWCKPCQRQGEILKTLEKTASVNQAKIVKVNVDHHPELAKKFQANALPTILVMKQGKIIERQQGLASAAKITSLLKR